MPTSRRNPLPLAPLILLPVLGGCVNLAPEVHIADRHTVLEQDASGSWPELEKRFDERVLRMGPVPLAEDPLHGSRRERAFSVLNGAFVNGEGEEGGGS
ncbi:hypothetical protein [Thiohalorhabdus methylotrophus]|uniref:Uncharacterized protein n=1 Tax=Thiohalorhabdus methylotrophus TaxID=3242694 RepID=A0ABV4TUB2_9GAMM